MSFLDHIHKQTAPTAARIPLLDAIKENPVGSVSEGYIKDRPAPFELKYLVESLRCHPLAFSCIRMISSQAAQARMIAYNDDGSVDERLTAVLDGPNPDYSGSDFRQMAYMSLAGLGNFAAMAERSGLNDIVELWPNRIDRMEYKLDGKGGIANWTYRYGGKKQTLSPEDVMHIRHQWIDMEQWGRSTASTQGANLKYHDGYNDWNNRLLDGAQGISEIYGLDSDEPLTPKQAEQIAATFNQFRLKSQMGMVGARALVNAKIKSISRGVSPEEMQVTEWFDRLTRSILQGFGIPSVLFDIGEGATYENQKEARASFWEDTLIPLYVDVLAGGLTRLTGKTVKADIDSVPALVIRRMERWKCVDGLTSWTLNEKREAQGKPPVDGGDIIYTDANKLPLGFGLDDDESIEAQVKDIAAKRGIRLVIK